MFFACEQPSADQNDERVNLAQVLSATAVRLEPIPLRVQMAYAFVKHCNEQMGPTGFAVATPNGVTSRVVKRELNVQQEKVFNLALTCLGQYFSEGVVTDDGRSGTPGCREPDCDQRKCDTVSPGEPAGGPDGTIKWPPAWIAELRQSRGQYGDGGGI